MSEDRVSLTVPSGSVGLAALDALSEEALELVVQANMKFLREHPEAPRFFESGVRYQLDDSDTNEWLTIPQILERGWGDCDQLAPWFAAELRLQGYSGVKVRLVKPSARPEDERVRHAVVYCPGAARELANQYPQLMRDGFVSHLGYVDPSMMMVVRNG